LPPRPIPLTELQSILRHPSTPLGVGDRAICAVVRRAQAHGGSWTVGLAGLLLPALRATVADVGRAWPDAVADLEAEMLAELVEQMQDCDTGSDRAARHLLWRVAKRARRRVVRDQVVGAGRGSGSPATEPHRPWGHPDFVLAEAVQDEVLSDFEAEMIGETRLGGVPLAEWAARVGWQPNSVRKERSEAERRLVNWLLAKKSTRESASNASVKGAGRSPVVDEHEPARVAQTPVGTAREVSPLARRLPATGTTRPGLEGSDRRSA
jgi:hypothetical protein